MGKVALNRAGQTVGFTLTTGGRLQQVELEPAPASIVVLLETESDLVAFRAAFRDTPGATDPSLGNDLDLFEFPLERLPDVQAVWAARFHWQPKAMAAFIDRLSRARRASAHRG